MATETEWAWLAGLFEGEGCISFTGRASVTLNLSMTDLDVVTRAHGVAGVGSFMGVVERENRKPLHCWRVSVAADVRHVLEGIGPWLGERRSGKVDQALARLALVRRPGYCKRDHPMRGDNLHVTRGGQRMCRACMRIRYEQQKTG